MDILFLFGLLFGMRHALDADHIVAIAALSTEQHNNKHALKMAVYWGAGHSLVVLILGGIIIFFTPTLPENISNYLEAFVGLVLAFMGLQIIYRLQHNQIHIHLHQHSHDKSHIHLHSHKHSPHHLHHHKSLAFEQKSPREKSSHKKTLLVGALHGGAGTAALVILAAENANSHLASFIYLIFFCIGTIIGMMLFSFVINIPINKAKSGKSNILNLRQFYSAIAIVSCSYGIWMIYQQI